MLRADAPATLPAATSTSRSPTPASATSRMLATVPARIVWPTSQSADWFQWRGPNRDGTYRQAGELKWAKAPVRAWRTALGGQYSSPVMAGGKVFCAGSPPKKGDSLVCFAAADGNILWSTPTVPAGSKHETISTPAVDGQTVFVYTGGGHVMAVSVADGQLLWSADLNAVLPLSNGHGTNCSPLVLGDVVMVNAGYGGIGLDKRTGGLLWRGVDLKHNFSHDSSPVPFELDGRRGVAFLAIDRGIIGVDPSTGAPLWEVPLQGYEEMYLDVSFRGQEVMLNGRRWFTVPGPTSQPVAKVPERASKWGQGYLSNLIVWKDCVLGFKEREKDDNNKSLYCMEWGTGKIRWEAPEIIGGAMLLVNDDHLVVSAGTGDLVTLRLTDEGAKELSRGETLRAKTIYRVTMVSTPAYSNNRVYYRVPGWVGCYDLSQEEPPVR
jgi:outer membrane protein assembly factor BamB